MPKKKTHEQFIQELNEIQPNIEVLGTYINTNTPILCRCKIDNHVWYPRPKHLLSNHGCPKCSTNKNSKRRTKTNEDFINEFNEKFPNSNIEILSEYVGVYDYIKCRCLLDDNIWEITPHNLLKGRGCPECAKRNFQGENNPRWNPTITDEEREIGRNYSDYKEWRESVFKRDNYTCQVTGKQGRLVAHHLYSYDINKEKRLDIDNGITILEEIHRKFHLMYGYGNNTLEQWNEFINNLR